MAEQMNDVPQRHPGGRTCQSSLAMLLAAGALAATLLRKGVRR